MSAHEIAEWAAYARVEPFGEARANWHMAVLAALLYNANRGQNAQPLDAVDFMWKVKPTKRQQQAEEKRKAKEMWQGFIAWAKGNQAIAEAKVKANNDHTG